ncbi:MULTISPECIES: nSTAND1 domain-containing NTPase [unclassified Saccharothrix]|uniref:nSTAND1 domain-containing NTPase n=1 Tax=unclassified Saccharothrix TaxID=2593673 RepID=UPI00307DD0FC
MARAESPLPAGELGAFAADLRALRLKAGNPTYRRLARDAHYSAAALSEAANGRRLPSLAVAVAYVRACGGDVVEWEARWRALAERRPAEVDDGTPPYAGLAPFQVGDADRFFGRDDLVRELTGLVARRRFVGVFGASGSGKSSVLRAGLVARSEGPAVVFTPGARPVQELAVRLAAVTGKSAPALAREFAAYPENLHLRVRQTLIGGDDDLLLVVDQFEEVFTLCADDVERSAFLAALTTAATTGSSRTRVVLGVRADFLGHCGRHPELVDALRGGHVLVGPMTADQLREAIVAPALAVGCKAETALVTRLVADAAGQPAALPLVSHALLETWRRRRGVALTLSGYEEAGGVEHSIARSAEHVYLGMSDADRAVAKRVFLRLIAVGDDTADTKRRVARDEVDHPEVLSALADARLVVLDRDTVEVAHEALIRRWPRLRDWIAEDRAGLRVQRMLTEAARGWESLDRDPGALFRGTRLALAREWAAGGAELTAAERGFLDASTAAQEASTAAEARRTRRLRRLVAVLGVLLVLAGVSTVRAVRAELSATEQRNIALARKVVNEAEALRDANPALALRLTLAAHRLAPLPETRDALLQAFGTPYSTRLDGVRDIAVSPHRPVVAVVDGATRRDAHLYDVSDPRRPVWRGVVDRQPGGVDALAFSTNGKALATVGATSAVVWDTEDESRPRPAVTLDVGPSPVAVALSPDGRYLAVGYPQRGPRVWDLSDPAHPPLVADLEGSASRSLAFLTDQVLVVAEGSGARAWSVPGGSPVDFAGRDGRVNAVAVADDGRLVAVAGTDRVVDLWDLADPARPVRLAAVEHADSVTAVALGTGGRLLATTGADRVARLWDLADRAAPVEVAVPAGQAGHAVGLPGGGRAVVTGAADGTARLVDLTDLPVVQPTQIRALHLGRDRDLAATVDVAGVLRLVDIAPPRGTRTAWPLTRHPGRVRAAALSADGEHVLTLGEDRRLRLWRTANPADPEPAGEVTGNVSVKSGHLAVRSTGGATALFDPESSGVVFTPSVVHGRTGGEGVSLTAFSPDGKRVAITPAGGNPREWETADPSRLPVEWSEVYQLRPAPQSAVVGTEGNRVAVEANGDAVLWRPGRGPVELASDARSVAASGDLVAVAGADGKVRLFDVSDRDAPRAVGVLRAHVGAVAEVRFARDGRTLVTAGGAEVRFWETDPERVVERICAAGEPVGEQEWARYFPGVPYSPPCP